MLRKWRKDEQSSAEIMNDIKRQQVGLEKHHLKREMRQLPSTMDPEIYIHY